jgi:hypothetical protein
MLIRAAFFAIVLLAPTLAAAQDPCLTETTPAFAAWLNCRIERVLAATGGPAGDDKQTETPSVSDDSSTLLDNSSASDFIGLGMSLIGVRNESGTQTTSGTTSATVTAYSLLSAAYGLDPLKDPNFYYSHANWRRVAVTIGRQPQRNTGKGLDAEAAIAGAKFVFLNLREISRTENLATIQRLMDDAAVSAANINSAVVALLASALAPGTEMSQFVTDDLKLASFKETLGNITPDVSQQVDRAISARIAADVALREAIRQKIGEIKRRPQASIAWSSNLRDGSSPNQHRLEAIVDYGMAPRLSFTANAGVDLVDKKSLTLDPTIDTNVGRIAGAFQLALGDTGVFGLRAAPKMSVAADMEWKQANRTWKAQWKFDLPVATGIVLPLSFTWADRPDAINEKEVRGTLGFTIDTAKLAASLK